MKIAVDCIEKGYATHSQVADFLGLSTERWKKFYGNFREGNVQRVPQVLRNMVSARDVKLLTGFTDDQLKMLDTAADELLNERLENLLLWAFVLLEAQHQNEATR